MKTIPPPEAPAGHPNPPYGRRDDRDALRTLTKHERAILALWAGQEEVIVITAFDIARQTETDYYQTCVDLGRLEAQHLLNTNANEGGTLQAEPTRRGWRIVDHIRHEAKTEGKSLDAPEGKA